MAAKTQAQISGNWDDIRVFLALFREGGLAAAASRLGVDPSTVSRRLSALESALGVRLFDRTREGLSPCHAAELLLGAAEQAESGHLRFAQDATQLEGSVEGVVRLSVPPGVADFFVGPALPRLYARHPKLRIELDASVRVVDLTRREADIAIRTIRPESGDLVMLKAASVRWVAMGSRAYTKELGRLTRWEDARWIDWGEDLRGIPPARWFSEHVRAEPVLRTSHFGTQLSAIQSGHGIALVPNVYARVTELTEVKYARSLEPTAKRWPVDDTWLVGHRALRNVPRIAAVWDFILEEVLAMPSA